MGKLDKKKVERLLSEITKYDGCLADLELARQLFDVVEDIESSLGLKAAMYATIIISLTGIPANTILSDLR